MALPSTRQFAIDRRLEPVEDEFGLMSLPGANNTIANESVARALERAKAGLYQSNLNNLPIFEGKTYDPNAYANLVKQLTAQQQALSSQYKMPYESTFGGSQETIADMAKRLAAMGLSNLSDFGMRLEIPVEKIYETVYSDQEGVAPTQVDTGRYKTVSGIGRRTSEGDMEYDTRELTPEEIKSLQTKNGGYYLTSGPMSQKDLMNISPSTGTVYYNKNTGEVIDTKKFGGKFESGIWGSSGAGEGYTNYRVQYDAQGNPVFYPEKNLSGMKEFVAKDLPGILSVLRFIPGAQIPVMLAQAGAAAYSGAKPGDVLKNLATTFVASNLGNILSKGIPGTDFKGITSLGFDMPTTDFGKMAFQAGTSGLSSLIQGGSPQDALKAAGLSAAGTGISGLMPTSTEFDYSKILQAAAPALASGRLKNADIFRLLAALAAKKKTPPGTR